MKLTKLYPIFTNSTLGKIKAKCESKLGHCYKDLLGKLVHRSSENQLVELKVLLDKLFINHFH